MKYFSEGAEEKLMSTRWPNNLLELKQVVEAATVRATSDWCLRIEAEHLVLWNDELGNGQTHDFNQILAETFLTHLDRALKWAGYKKDQKVKWLAMSIVIWMNIPDCKRSFHR